MQVAQVAFSNTYIRKIFEFERPLLLQLGQAIFITLNAYWWRETELQSQKKESSRDNTTLQEHMLWLKAAFYYTAS